MCRAPQEVVHAVPGPVRHPRETASLNFHGRHAAGRPLQDEPGARQRDLQIIESSRHWGNSFTDGGVTVFVIYFVVYPK